MVRKNQNNSGNLQVITTADNNAPTTERTNDAMDMDPYMTVGDGTTAPPIYSVIQKTRTSDQSEASAPAEGGLPLQRLDSLYPETTLIENDLYD